MVGHTDSTDCGLCDKNCINLLITQDDNDKLIKGGRKLIHYKKGETIVKQGSFASHIFFLRKGLVKLVIEGYHKKSTILKLEPSGSFICLSTLFTDDFFPYTIVALKDCEVCLIKKDLLNGLMHGNPKLNEFLINLQSQEFVYLLHRISILSTRNNHGKLAEALLFISREDLQREGVSKILSRNELADLASISLESTNKILNELKNDLIISWNGKGLEVNKIDLLVILSRVG